MHFDESRTARSLLALSLLGLTAALLHAQQNVPTVTFEHTFPGADPSHYTISVTSECNAAYQSDGKLSEVAAPDNSSKMEFSVTKPNCERIFSLTKRAHYFDREIDSKKKNLASMGLKVLSYKDGIKSTHATYNYSPIAEVMELTTFFQQLGATLEFGRRLEFEHRYQKLALDEDLKRMEELRAGTSIEIQAISPVLQKIIDDPSLMKVVRSRAQRLVEGMK